MATSVQFAGMASSGFVLKSVSAGTLKYGSLQNFSVQNEGDFCLLTRDSGKDSTESSSFNISKIDDIPVSIKTISGLIFGKNIEVKPTYSDINYHIYEYGPAE